MIAPSHGADRSALTWDTYRPDKGGTLLHSRLRCSVVDPLIDQRLRTSPVGSPFGLAVSISRSPIGLRRLGAADELSWRAASSG